MLGWGRPFAVEAFVSHRFCLMSETQSLFRCTEKYATVSVVMLLALFCVPAGADDAAVEVAGENLGGPATGISDSSSETDSAAEDDGFANDTDRISYAFGADIGSSFRDEDFPVNLDLLEEAIRAAHAGEETRLNAEQTEVVWQIFQEILETRNEEKAAAEALENRERGEAFLAKNAGREGVVTTPSGLQYEVFEWGQGKTPGEGDEVELHYTGALIDGEVFEATFDMDPVFFELPEVIPGLREGLQLLPVGTKAKLFIPEALAYGDSPRGPGGPGSTLTFEVEIFGSKPPPAALTIDERIAEAQAQLDNDIAFLREEHREFIDRLETERGAEGGDDVDEPSSSDGGS